MPTIGSAYTETYLSDRLKYRFDATSGNKNVSTKTLKRIEFEFKGSTFKFLLNPDTYEQTETNRMNITHTKVGAYVEAFGANIVEISLSGMTGLKNNSSDPESGYRQFKALRDLIKSVYDNVVDGQEITDFLNFYNFTDNEYYVTYPDKFVLSRSKNQPLLYKYTIHLYCLRRIGEKPKEVKVINVANPMKVENTIASAGVDDDSKKSTTESSLGIWQTYEDAAADGYAFIKTKSEFERGGVDKSNYGTYSAYLRAKWTEYWAAKVDAWGESKKSESQRDFFGQEVE